MEGFIGPICRQILQFLINLNIYDIIKNKRDLRYFPYLALKLEILFVNLALLFGGFVALGIGAELTINCSIKTAWRLGLSPLLIGLTLVSIGTSIPEISISIAGGLDRLAGIETSGIVIGDKVGSVLNQMTIILGICGLFGTLTVPKRTVKRDGISSLISLFIFFLVILDRKISIIEGYLLILCYVGYIAYLMIHERKIEIVEEDHVKDFKICRMEQPVHSDIILLFVGIAAIGLGSETILRAGIELAKFLNVEQSAIGVTFVGFGTGLPELIVSLRAIKKGDISISIGNLIGSNITNILLSTGIGSVIAGFIVDEKILFFDTPVTILIVVIALLFLRTGEKLDRRESVILIFIYILVAALVLGT